eukprot:COSAG03_NODE_8251_length_820_cov_1.242718_3_plen_57_part_01
MNCDDSDDGGGRVAGESVDERAAVVPAGRGSVSRSLRSSTTAAAREGAVPAARMRMV